MTIVVAVAAPDGIVLAGDSRTTLTGAARPHRIGSDTADKVFVCGRCAVATHGAAMVGDNTIAGHMSDFVAQVDEDGCPEDLDSFCGAFGQFFHERFIEAHGETEPGVWPLGFLVAGYDTDGVGRLRDVLIPGPDVTEVEVSTAERGVVHRGQNAVILRLLDGVDWVAVEYLQAAEHIETPEMPEAVVEFLGGLEYDLLPPLTIQDAVDLAVFLIRTTIDMQRFSDGLRAVPGSIPACGGPIRVAVIRPRDVEWVSAPTLTAALPPGTAEGAAG